MKRGIFSPETTPIVQRTYVRPVGLDDRDIDAIHRGAAHQANRADRSNGFSPLAIGNESF
jgi:hypothetical protein